MISCAQSGCAGTIEDGYCDVCGMAGPAASSATPPMTQSARSARSTRSLRTTPSRSARVGSRMLGGRPLARPQLLPLDPMAAIVPGVVPERRRFCSGCDVPLKRDAGFCPKCGQEYSFVPSLSPGDVIAAKYEVKGTLAFGGLGFIYLAKDTVLTRWVTLKGLLHAKDPRMQGVAVAEREYLAAVKHPNIVGIYDFVTHGEHGYIVMEYVNGKTLMRLRQEAGGPLPAAEAISYVAEILPAFQHLDEMGLVYCDMKPENVMVEEATVKLIDLGAVRRVDDVGGDVYGSRGYAAPEAPFSPTPLSDLYSVARALAVLCASFDYQGKHEHSLPPREEVPAFSKHEALYRFLVKATREKPEERFQSAAEMACQLVGVLRTVAGATHDLGPIQSTLFLSDPERASDPDAEGTTEGMPKLRVNPDDAAAPVALAASAVTDPERRLALWTRALAEHPESVDLALRRIEELIALGRFAKADEMIRGLRAADANAVRPRWLEGVSNLAQQKKREARAVFEALSLDLPGELAPVYALGVALEETGKVEDAIRCHDLVSSADPTFTRASFRLARCLAKKGDRAGAVSAYRRVPSTSSHHGRAQMAIARLLVTPAPGLPFPPFDDLVSASRALSSLGGLMGSQAVEILRAELYTAAAMCVSGTRGIPDDAAILGVRAEETSLRLAAEEAYRSAARQAESDEERWDLVDRANEVRPVTWT